MIEAPTLSDSTKLCTAERIQRAKWATARIAFLVVAVTGTATGGVGAYLLGPLYSWYFFNDTRFHRYHRLSFPLIATFWKLIWEWMRNPVYRRAFSIPLTAPPMMEPDLSLVKVRADWTETDGSCNGCVQCCVRRDCPMLDTEQNVCRSYGSFFWRYFNCGRYPESDEQIRCYDCPKWEVRGGTQTAAP